MASNYELDKQTLTYIYYRAVEHMKGMDYLPSKNPMLPSILELPEIQRTYCFTMAVIDFLRANEMIPYTIEFKEKLTTSCAHKLENILSSTGICSECGEPVQILLMPKPTK